MDETAIILGLLASKVHEEVLEDDVNIILSEKELDSLANLPMLFIDAGTMSDDRGFVVKLALLTRLPERGKVKESVYHPAPRIGEKWFLPVFFSSANDKARQALTYLIELTAIYTALTNPKKVFKKDVDEAIVFRHGPLLQMVSQYLAEPYLVNAYDVVNALVYAGVSRGEALSLIEGSYKCISKGGVASKDRNVVVLGLLILNLLKEINERIKQNKNMAVFGVVEDVSQSKSLLAYTISSVVYSALHKEVAETLSTEELAFHIASSIRDKLRFRMREAEFKRILNDCICLDPNSDLPTVVYNVESTWADLIERLDQVLRTRFRKSLSKATRSEIEAAFIWSSLTDINDAYLMYTLYYVSKDKVPFTKPIENKARLEIFKKYLKVKEYLKCYEDPELEYLDELLNTFMYQYVAPVYPFDKLRCDQISKSLSTRSLKLDVKPCTLSNMINVPSPMRIEYISNEPLIREGLSFVYYSSILTPYGFPTQMLLVDKYSRVSISDLMSVEDLLEALSKRFKPYSVFVHKWITRKSFM